MRAAIAARVIGMTKEAEQTETNTLKRVVGYMITRHLCSNPFRYSRIDSVMNTTLFDAVMQLLTLVTRDDNDVRVFYHLTQRAVLSRITNGCVLAPVPVVPRVKGVGGGGVGGDGLQGPATKVPPSLLFSKDTKDGRVSFRDVRHMHAFGGQGVKLAAPSAGRVLPWHMYDNTSVDADAADVSRAPPRVLDLTGRRRGVSSAVAHVLVQPAKSMVSVQLPTVHLFGNRSIEFGKRRKAGSDVEITDVPSPLCSFFFAVTRYLGDAEQMPDMTKDFSQFVCLASPSCPSVYDVLMVVKPPQLLVTANLHKDFSALRQLETYKNMFEEVIAKLKAGASTRDADTTHMSVQDFLHM
jgi:hypothetical protein